MMSASFEIPSQDFQGYSMRVIVPLLVVNTTPPCNCFLPLPSKNFVIKCERYPSGPKKDARRRECQVGVGSGSRKMSLPRKRLRARTWTSQDAAVSGLWKREEIPLSSGKN